MSEVVEPATTEVVSSEEATAPSAVKRDRKKTVFFTANVTPKKESATSVDGTGTALIENEKFCKELDKYKGDSDLLKAIHMLFYSTPGKKTDIKKNIRKFSGFPADAVKDDIVAKISSKKAVWTVTKLKAFAEMLGVEKGGARDVLIERVVDFLMCPSTSAKPSAHKRSRSTPAKGSSSKSPKQKRTKKEAKEDEAEGEDADEEAEVAEGEEEAEEVAEEVVEDEGKATNDEAVEGDAKDEAAEVEGESKGEAEEEAPAVEAAGEEAKEE